MLRQLHAAASAAKSMILGNRRGRETTSTGGLMVRPSIGNTPSLTPRKESLSALVSVMPCACGIARCAGSRVAISSAEPNMPDLLYALLTPDMASLLATGLHTPSTRGLSGVWMGPEGQSSFITMGHPTHPSLSRPTQP